MRTYQCESFSVPPQIGLKEVETPAPGPGELLIRVAATGVGYVDALICSGGYQVKPELPFTPCAETAGEVVAVGEGVSGVAPGTMVLAMALRGALADFAIVKAGLAVALPAQVDPVVAAACGTNYCTALYGIDELGRAAAGETILVAGAAGGLGMAAIDVARSRGLRVIALASSEAKRAAAIAQGAAMAFDYGAPDWREAVEASVGRGAIDLVFDPVGGDFSDTAFRMLAPGGRYLVAGFVSGSIARLPLNLPLLKRASLVGVDWGGALRAEPARFARTASLLVAGLENGALRPSAIARLPFEQAGSALGLLLDRRLVGKAVVIPA